MMLVINLHYICLCWVTQPSLLKSRAVGRCFKRPSLCVGVQYAIENTDVNGDW